jgi:hypothetical protein
VRDEVTQELTRHVEAVPPEQAVERSGEITFGLALHAASEPLPRFVDERTRLLDEIHIARGTRLQRRTPEQLQEPAMEGSDGYRRLRRQKLFV